MTVEPTSRSATPTMMLLVRNAVDTDARVLRAARAAAAVGWGVVVVGVVSEEQRAPRASIDGLNVIRLDPRSPATRLRTRLRGSTTGIGVEPEGSAPPRRPIRHGKRRGPVARMHRLARTLDFYRQALAVLRVIRPQIVHCNDYNTMWVGVAARALGAAVVYDSHELWADRNGRPEARWWLLAVERVFVRVANAVIVTSPGHGAALAARYHIAMPTVVRNIPEWVAEEHLAATPARAEIAYVGGLMPGRGLEIALRALQLAPHVTLRIVGPGSATYRAHLEGAATELGVADRVDIRQPVKPGAVAATIADAAAGLCLIEPICGSYRLSLPNKLFEYFAAGLPVIASDLPVIGDFVARSGAGLVVDPDDIEAVAQAFIDITTPERNRELRVKARALRGSLDPARESELLMAVYTAALGAA